MNTPRSILALLVAMSLTLGACKKNTSEPAPGERGPTVKLLTAVTPAKGLPNSAVTITGSNFNTDKTKLDVRFNGMAATVYSATATQIIVGVPQTAATGKITVTSNGVTSTSATAFTVVSAVQSTWQNINTLCATIDRTGTIYATTGKIIYKGSISNPGSLASFATLPSFAGLYNIAVDPAGIVYVVDRGRPAVYKIGATGAVTPFAGGAVGRGDGQGLAAGFVSHGGLTIDAAGNLYMTDGPKLRKVTPSGLVTTFAGSNEQGNIDGIGASARFGELTGITIDAAGSLYVTDNINKNIRKITADGTVSTVAGSGRGGYDDGPSATASFGYPKGIAVDAAGNIFVTDYDYPLTSTIRMINTAGYVSTFLQGNTQTVANGPINASSTYFSDSVVFDAAGNMYISNLGVVSKVAFN